MEENLILKKAIQKAENYCARAEKCIVDVKKKLIDWGFFDDMLDEVIFHLTKNKFIDEERFAIAFANDKFKFNKWGKIKIKAHLNHKQIPSVYICIAIDKIPEDEYNKMVNAVLNSKLTELKRKESDAYKLKAKLFNFCQSRGFETSFLNDFVE